MINVADTRLKEHQENCLGDIYNKLNSMSIHAIQYKAIEDVLRLHGYFDRWSYILLEGELPKIDKAYLDIFIKFAPIDYVLEKCEGKDIIFYHTTSKTNVPRIKESGLLKSNIFNSFGEGIYVYLHEETDILPEVCVTVYGKYSGIYYRCIAAKSGHKHVDGKCLLEADVVDIEGVLYPKIRVKITNKSFSKLEFLTEDSLILFFNGHSYFYNYYWFHDTLYLNSVKYVNLSIDKRYV